MVKTVRGGGGGMCQARALVPVIRAALAVWRGMKGGTVGKVNLWH